MVGSCKGESCLNVSKYRNIFTSYFLSKRQGLSECLVDQGELSNINNSNFPFCFRPSFDYCVEVLVYTFSLQKYQTIMLSVS